MKKMSLVSIFICIMVIFNSVIATSLSDTEVLLNILENIDTSSINYLEYVNIKDYEYEEIKEFTIELTKYCTSDKEKMNTIFKWVNSNIEYGNSDNDPYPVFKNRKGVCQGYANLYATMMNSINIPTVIMQGMTYFGAHAWCMTLNDEKWILTDPTNNMIFYDIQEYDEKYTKKYFKPYYTNTNLYTDERGYIYSFYNGLAIVGTNKELEELNLPNTVLNINLNTFCFSSADNSIKKIFLNKNINNIVFNGKYDSNSIEHIEVDENNGIYSSYKGILYNKDFTNIEYVPIKIKEVDLKPINHLEKGTVVNRTNVSSVRINEGTEIIEEYAFEGLNNLEKVYIPDSITRIQDNAFYNCGKFTIYANCNSFAEKYALENDIKLVLLDQEILKGDMNKDGKVNATDAAMVLDRYKYKNATQEDMRSGDLNNDGKLNATDAAFILDIYKSN